MFAFWLPILGAGMAFALAAIGLATLATALLLANRRTLNAARAAVVAPA